MGRGLVSRRGIVRILAIALSFMLLVAVLRYLHQTPMSWIGIGLVSARYAAVREVAILKIIRLLLLNIVGLRTADAAVHEIHVVALIFLQLALLLLLCLHALVHLIGDI